MIANYYPVLTKCRASGILLFHIYIGLGAGLQKVEPLSSCKSKTSNVV